MVRAVPRDLLPLPIDPMLCTTPLKSLGRACRQRIRKDAAVRERCNDCGEALNDLFGGGEFTGFRPSEAQLCSLLHIEEAVKADPPPCPLEDPEASLSAMLGSRASAYSVEGSTCVAPLQPDSTIAWPDVAGSAELSSVLPVGHSDLLLGGRTNLARPAQEQFEVLKEGRASVYWDPRLKSSRSAYVSFVKELKNRNMCKFQLEKPLERVGVFFVRRKDGRLRLIVDARRTNQRVRTPPTTRLASASALSEIIVDESDIVRFSVQDIANCFYELHIPDGLSQWFGLMPLTASDQGIAELQGEVWDPHQLIFPVLSVLPMGFSWSVFWTQEAHRFLVNQSKACPIDAEIIDKKPAPDLTQYSTARLLYIDNQLFMSTEEHGASSARRSAHSVLSQHHLPLHEIVDDVTLIDSIGFELDGIRKICRSSKDKRWRLRLGTQAFLRRTLVSGQQLEALLGHWTFGMLANRPSLSIFKSAYRFVRAHYRVPSKLWPSVPRELRNALGIQPLLYSCWSRSFSTTVTCSDACVTGYAAHTGEWPQLSVKGMWRYCERWRSRLEGGARGIHESALQRQIQDQNLEPSSVHSLCQESSVGLDTTFPELPYGDVAATPWKLTMCEPFVHDQSIHAKEMHGAIGGVKRQMRQKQHHGKMHLAFCDKSWGLSCHR